MAKLVDPDSLNQNTEVNILSGERKIDLAIAGNLNNDSPGQTSGVTLQALYSFLKEEWIADANLNKYRFPLKGITKFKFDWQNSWHPNDQQTRDLLRDAGWKEVDGREQACIISLGDFHATTDQAYYQNVVGFDQDPVNFDKTGALNESYMTYSGEGPLEYRTFGKFYLRIAGKSYDEGNLIVDQGWATIEYDAYRIPLSNAIDPNITLSGEADMAGAPFSGMAMQFIPGETYETFDYANVPYSSGEVVYSGERWYQVGYHVEDTSDPPPHADYVSFSGERELASGEFYAYNRIIDGNNATNLEIYEFAQFRLRSGEDINNDDLGLGFGTVNGDVAVPLLGFVGTTLVTNPGVFIDNYNINFKNAIQFSDITVDGDINADGNGLDSEWVPETSTIRTFPFVSAGTMKFNVALQGDGDAEYWMYFANANGNVYDDTSAICVEDADGVPISGEVQGSGEITFSFSYSGNNQGGRTPDTNADVILIAMGLDSAEWVEGTFTIIEATGLDFSVNAPDERNYDNP
jgi:hypothetical protein